MLQLMSLPPQTALAANRLERQLPGGICTRKESAPFHGARKKSCKFNWDCTICRSCRWRTTEFSMLK